VIPPPADDPLFKPLTLAEVIEITGRSRRTIERWIAAGRLPRYIDPVSGRAVFNEFEVVNVESERHSAALENWDRIRRRLGRPRRTEGPT
jgi:predicted DNA-binding transcriptional regulator AlpA